MTRKSTPLLCDLKQSETLLPEELSTIFEGMKETRGEKRVNGEMIQDMGGKNGQREQTGRRIGLRYEREDGMGNREHSMGIQDKVLEESENL